jgi:hypothetical protein
MKYKITEIKFNFKDLTEEQENDIINDTVNTDYWEVDTPEELSMEISKVTGYTVNTVDFHLIPD